MRKLDVGSGLMEAPGWESLDKTDAFGADHVHDITSLPWPFPDNTFAEIKCSHVLEHIDRALLVPVMNEMHRIMAAGGQLYIEAPVAPHWKAFADPTHVSFLVPQTFLYFTDIYYRNFRTLYGMKEWDTRPEDKLESGFRIQLDDDGGIMGLWLVKGVDA